MADRTPCHERHLCVCTRKLRRSLPLTKQLQFTLVLLFTTVFASAQPIDIGSRLELMIDDYLIESQQVVSWTTGPDVSGLAGKPVRLRFVLKDANLHSLRFP